MKHYKLATLLFFSILVLSCSKTKKLSDYGQKFSAIIKTDEALFRGNNMGDDLYPVYENEQPKHPAQEEKNYLFYEIKNDSGELYSIEYNFNEKFKLADIRLDYYSAEKNTARVLFDSFKSYFTDVYGKTEDAFGYAQWHLKNGTTIELIDESSEYKQGKLTLLFYTKQ